jgi:hypothetical protein
MSRRLPLSLAAAGTLAVAVFATAPADAAKQVRLKFFSQSESVKLTDPSGNPLANGGPAAGDRLVSTDRNFVGNHKHHAKRYTSTDHLSCTFTSAAAAVCDGQIAIGSSLVFSDRVPVNLSEPNLTIPLTGGTGRFKGMKGTAVAKAVAGSDDTDVVITLH